jgi:hypothetical protein
MTLSLRAAEAAITFDPVGYMVDTPSLRPDYIRVADVDRDGRPDLVVSEENGNVYVYRAVRRHLAAHDDRHVCGRAE